MGAVTAYKPLDAGSQSTYASTLTGYTGGLYQGRITTEGVTRGKRKGVNYLIKVL